MNAAPLLQADNVAVELGGRIIVHGAVLSLRAGELVALVGPNGAGKTTLVRALAGLIPAQGDIAIAGRALAAMPMRERARRLAYLPQGHVFHWPMSAAAVVALGRHPYADAFSPMSEYDRAAVRRALTATATEELAERSVATLSGGERARVALARVLATEAAIVLADEPTVSLDPRHQLIVMQLLRGIAGGGAVLAIVHDLTLAARFADRVLVMDRGRIIADAPPRQALSLQRIAQVFGVEAVSVDAGDGPLPLPRRPL